MSYPYLDIAKAVALRANQLGDGDASARDTAYSALTLDGVEVPTTALKDTVLSTGAEIAEMIGNSDNEIFRGPITSESSAITYGAALPTVDATSNPFVGEFDSFLDTSKTPAKFLIRAPLQEVERYYDSKKSHDFWKINPYLFAINGTRLYHTGSTVVARGCIWNTTTQAGLYAAGACPLPVGVKMLHIAMVLAALPTESWFIQEAQYYSQLVVQKASMIIAGKHDLTELPK